LLAVNHILDGLTSASWLFANSNGHLVRLVQVSLTALLMGIAAHSGLAPLPVSPQSDCCAEYNDWG
jgi:hypothetical protein